jgi:predicted alpha/beta-hydrolase family hydrolase
MAKSSLLFNGPARAPLTFAFAHGAGAPMDDAFMTFVAEGIATAGFRVARFEFPYMAARRKDGHKRPPDRHQVLCDTVDAVAAELGTERLVLGGKSMGGRICSERADALGVRGLICLGFPFHAPAKPVGNRADALKAIKTPTLILQGERDAFGTAAEVPGYGLPPRKVRVHFLADGDHSLKPRKASGRTEEQNLDEAVAEAVKFLKRIAK